MPYPSTVKQIEDRIKALATTYATICKRVECPHKTNEGGTAGVLGRTVAYLQIGTGTGQGRPRILIVGGMHAREWAPPDAVLTFVEKLLEAYTKKKPVNYAKFQDTRDAQKILYKAFTIPNPDVVQIVENTELYVLPCANPDGRDFTMAGKTPGWRKNRRPAPAGVTCPPLQPGLKEEDKKWVSNDPAGVDLNRNFEIAWDFTKYYSDNFFAHLNTTYRLGVSDSPCSLQQTFHGPGSASEPEVQNIQELITGKKINFYLDVHSAAAKFLFAWGMANNQEKTAAQTFKNSGLDRTAPGAGGRDVVGSPPTYAEWMPPGSEKSHQTLGDLMNGAIQDSTGYTASDTDATAVEARRRSNYISQQSIGLFGMLDFETGVSRDFAFSQQIVFSGGAATAGDPVFSYTFECGRKEDGFFQPKATTEYPKVEREVAAGLWKFMTYAATWHAPVPPPTPPPPPVTPPSPPPTSTGSDGGSHCYIATACYGSPYAREVQFLRHLRDKVLRYSRFGLLFFDEFWEQYYSFSPRLARQMTASPDFGTKMSALAVEPLIHFLRIADAYARGGWQQPDFAKQIEFELDRRRVPAVEAGDFNLEEIASLIGDARRSAYVDWGLLAPLGMYWSAIAGLQPGESSGQVGQTMLRELEEWLINAPIPAGYSSLSEPEMEADLALLSRTLFTNPALRGRFRARLVTMRDRQR